MSNSFSFDIITGENGYKYYLVPETTILYRGDTTLYPNFQLPNSPAFFSTDARFVKKYGLVFTFKPIKPLKLLVLDNHADYSLFYNSSPSDVQRILKNNYGYGTGLRETDFKKDHELVKHICRLGLDGYANNRMRITMDSIHDFYEGDDDDTEAEFHPEMAICNTNNLELIGMEKYTEKQIETAVLKKKQDILKWEMDDKRRKNRRRYQEQENTSSDEDTGRGLGLFGSPGKMEGPMFSPQLSFDSSFSSPSRVSSLTSFSTSHNTSGSDNSENTTPVGSPPTGNLFDSPVTTPIKRSRPNYGGKRKTKNIRKQKKKGRGSKRRNKKTKRKHRKNNKKKRTNKRR